MSILTDRIGEARHRFVDAKQAHRDAENDRADYEAFQMATVGYDDLGSNAKAREVAFTDLLRQDERYQNLLQYERRTQAAMEQAEVDLECLLDERRAQESETWAKIADYLVGRVDHVGYAPTQAARHVAKMDAAVTVMENLEAERVRAQEAIGSGDGHGNEPEEEYEIPF